MHPIKALKYFSLVRNLIIQITNILDTSSQLCSSYSNSVVLLVRLNDLEFLDAHFF